MILRKNVNKISNKSVTSGFIQFSIEPHSCMNLMRYNISLDRS